MNKKVRCEMVRCQTRYGCLSRMRMKCEQSNSHCWAVRLIKQEVERESERSHLKYSPSSFQFSLSKNLESLSRYLESFCPVFRKFVGGTQKFLAVRME